MLLEGAAQAKTSVLVSQLTALPELLSAVERFSLELAEHFVARPPTGVRILSAGPNLATAEYGMAKLIKLLPLPVWSDEVEEFAHRQFWSCPATDLVIYVTNPAVARCASTSAAGARLHGHDHSGDRHAHLSGERSDGALHPTRDSRKSFAFVRGHSYEIHWLLSGYWLVRTPTKARKSAIPSAFTRRSCWRGGESSRLRAGETITPSVWS